MTSDAADAVPDAADAVPDAGPVAPVLTSYAAFGYRFFETAVTPARVQAAVAGLAGRQIEIGPTGVGPIGLVKVRALGEVGTPVTQRRPDPDHVTYALDVPIDLRLTIELGIDKNRFHAQVVVHLTLTARAAEPLQIVIDVAEPTPQDVEVELTADGMRASVLKVVAGVEREIKRTVAKTVRRELDKPAVRRARVIDVARHVEGA